MNQIKRWKINYLTNLVLLRFDMSFEQIMIMQKHIGGEYVRTDKTFQ